MNTNRIRLSESKLREIVRESVKRVINERREKRYIYQCYCPYSESGFCDSINEIQDLISKSSYWDLSRNYGSTNITDPKNLVAWGGKGGYWYNVLHEDEFLPERLRTKLSDEMKEYILSKRID